MKKIRIKDIAERAGVSVGTVDRILHDRPNVSKKAREKVEKALEEMHYQPNAYASALALNRQYNFHVLLPQHNSEAYWQEIEEGVQRAEQRRNDFEVNVSIAYYKRFDDASFREAGQNCLDAMPDGVVIVPTALEITRELTDELHRRNVPFVMLDSYMPDLRPLAFFGQDSFCSGYFAARMFMMLAGRDKRVMLMRQTHKGYMTSKQQANREVGFRHYMRDHFPEKDIITLDLPLDGTKRKYDDELDEFFNKYPDVKNCITLNSKAHIIGEYLLKNNRRNVQIMGYDMVPKNVKCIEQGSISFLIAQHAFQQGYASIDALFHAVVLKEKVEPVNYMPIELLTKDNYQFYRRTQL